MKRDELNDLAAFVAVADEMSFTRAASKLEMSPSALSHAMKSLEGRLGLRLLSRTTRSVSTTEAGERLLKTLRPAFEEISTELTALGELRAKPAGTVRIMACQHSATTLFSPVLPDFLVTYPEIRVEITIVDAPTDIVAGRYDAGIHLSDYVEKDMISVRIGPELRFAVVASPAYFADHPPPRSPRDLDQHRCISYRLGKDGGLCPWEFREEGRPIKVRVDGPLVFNDFDLILAATLAGQGVAHLFENQVTNHLASGRLIRVLDDWCPPFPGYSLYHPSRRQTPPALAALIAALRDQLASRRPA